MVKGTKTSLELGRTFATLLADMSLRHSLTECHNEKDFRRHMMAAANNVADPNGNENVKMAAKNVKLRCSLRRS